MEASNVKAMREALEKLVANKEKPMEASSTNAPRGDKKSGATLTATKQKGKPR